MPIILLIIVAALGYLMGLNVPLLIEIPIYVVVCALIFKSNDYRNAELGQIVYHIAILALCVGAVIGNIVYAVAHWNDPSTVSFLSIIGSLFKP